MTPLRRALPILLSVVFASSVVAADAVPLEEAAAALAAGRCAEAAVLVEPLTEAPDPPEGAWRLLGDALRCLGEARPAVAAYQRHLAGVPDDPTVLELIATLRQRLGSIRVVVRVDRPAPVHVTATPVVGERATGVLQPDGSWLIEDLEPGTRPRVTVRGMGVTAVDATPPSVPRGGEAALVVEPAWIGIGVLEVTAAPAAGVSVEVRAPDGWTTVLPGTPMRVTAGMAEIAIVGPRGRVETEVVIEADARSLFDPAPWLPTALTVRGVPAGAELRLFLEGVEPPLERTMALDPHVGAVDGEWGIRVAPPVVLDGLVGGSGSLVLSHETLGLTAAELTLEPGGENSLELDWRDLEHSVEVRQRYLGWLDARARVRRATSARAVTGASVGVAGVILSSVGWALAVQGSRDLNAAREGALAGAAHPDGVAGWQQAHAAALRQEGGGVALGVVGITLGAAGVVFAGAFGADGKVRLDRVGAWSPP